jgi:hypothetical protein
LKRTEEVIEGFGDDFVGWKTCDCILCLFGNHVAATFENARLCHAHVELDHWFFVLREREEREERGARTLAITKAVFREEKKVCVMKKRREGRRGGLFILLHMHFVTSFTSAFIIS